MSKGDRVRLFRDVEWEGKIYPKGSIGTIVRMGSSGYFIRIASTEIYVFRSEVMK